MKKLLPILLAALLCACARAPGLVPVDQNEMAAWEKMRSVSAPAAPARVQLSMRFGEEGNTRRALGLLWGNGDDAYRLDIMAGVGATIAMIAESGDKFLLYAPREKRAYEQLGPERPLLKIGAPLPVGLASLARLLNGRYADVFSGEPLAAKAAGADTIYEVDTPAPGELVLAPDGLPQKFRLRKGGWSMDFAYPDGEAGSLPRSLRLHNLNGKMAIILVKSREIAARPFSATQMSLDLPAGTAILPFSDLK